MIINEKFKYREIAGQFYLIPTGEEAERYGNPFQLTETAAWIWKQIEKGMTPAQAASNMTEIFDVDDAGAAKAVEGFIKILKEMHIVREGTDERENDE